MSELSYSNINPFGNRQRIHTEEAFVGRERELSTICSYLNNRNPVALVGERRIGKSSLLYHLFLTGNRRLGDPEGRRFRFLYLDMLSAMFGRPADFVGEVLSELKVEADPKELEDFPPKALIRGLKEYKKQGILPVLLIDEFEKLTEKKALFTEDFFENLRSCCGSRLMGFVSASRRPLKELGRQNSFTSPFWNVVPSEPLGLFTCDECLKFIEVYWTPLGLTTEEKGFLLTYGGLHPLFLQIVSFHLLQNRQQKLSEKELKQKIEENLTDFFRNSREKVSRWLKQKVPKGLDKIDSAIDFLGKQGKNISQFLKHFNPVQGGDS